MIPLTLALRFPLCLLWNWSAVFFNQQLKLWPGVTSLHWAKVWRLTGRGSFWFCEWTKPWRQRGSWSFITGCSRFHGRPVKCTLLNAPLLSFCLLYWLRPEWWIFPLLSHVAERNIMPNALYRTGAVKFIGGRLEQPARQSPEQTKEREALLHNLRYHRINNKDSTNRCLSLPRERRWNFLVPVAQRSHWQQLVLKYPHWRGSNIYADYIFMMLPKTLGFCVIRA